MPCKGAAGLLAVRTARLCVGVVMSQIHMEISVGRKAEFGDGYDIWHAILAATADVFVTRDDRLFNHLVRVPNVGGFRVVKSLREALAVAFPAKPSGDYGGPPVAACSTSGIHR